MSPGPGSPGPGSDARRYEVLGRVLAALAAEPEAIESCRDLAWWQGAGDGWEIEWREGPYAGELSALLADRLRDGGLDELRRGPAEHATAVLEVLGVPVTLCAIDPIGLDRMRHRPGVWRMAQALDPLQHTAVRSPWEELLGG
ncbi:hypothetical protein [Acrocarpospora catenulata]|uniref:hypothetical protein n=1 Tax=Acrocarpospora catenulata TaxID=2836182 RepID=UPI0027E19652|nr:hypothetical protein [Acrocarpospora catenulata]